MTTIRATSFVVIKHTLSLLLLAAVCTGCFPRSQPLKPRMQYVAKKSDLRPLQSPFPALEPHERKTDWGIEYQVGLGFARELDLYRAITSFKRALILLPRSKKERRLELNYHIAHCYFLGDRYDDFLVTVEESDLLQVTPDFPAYQDLLVMLHTAYVATGECDKAEFMAASAAP